MGFLAPEKMRGDIGNPEPDRDVSRAAKTAVKLRSWDSEWLVWCVNGGLLVLDEFPKFIDKTSNFKLRV